MLISYHNDSKLKKSIVDEMRKHQKNDQFIKGSYGKMNGKFKGCAVGCAINSFNVRLGKNYETSSHKSFEEAIGVPEWLARIQDTIFEGLPEDENSKFAVDFLNAIPVGVNLEPVKWHFCAFILKENIDRVLGLKDISDELKKQVIDAIRKCLALNEEAIKTGIWNESVARSAESAAWSAERSAASAAASAARSAASAATSAARSAESAAASAERSAASAASATSAARSAESAAWSAASAASAARSAAYKRYAKELLRLLKNCKSTG